LDNISSCTSFDGDITLDPSLTTATINGVVNITGSLSVSNSSTLNSISAPTLESIGDTFNINIATTLETLNFPVLTSVGSINWLSLPQLSAITFPQEVTNATNVVISDTGLTSLNGINVQNVATFNINNNRALQAVTVGLQTVTNALSISFNGNAVQASFPDLLWANNATFQDLSSISLPNITAVNNSLGFVNNSIPGLSLPQLKTVGQSLFIVANNQLTNISFPKLSTIGGGFQIANNTDLNTIMGFPKVSSVGGAIDFVGNFSSAALPALDVVRGGVDIESDNKNFNCSAWNQAHDNGDIQGNSYVCKAASSSTSVAITATGSSTGSSNAAAATTTSSSSKNAAPVAGVVQYGSVIGALFAFIVQFA
jgi:hypothetical protein